MRILTFVVVSCFVLTQSFQGKASGQTYTIESFDGKLVKIRLDDQSFDGSLKVSTSKDSLLLPDVLALKEVSHLGKRFLKIRYSIDGGTGVLVTRTVVISVLKGKQITSSLIFDSGLSVLSFDFKQFLTVKSALSNQEDSSSYELNLILHDRQVSTNNKIPNYDSSQHAVLKFDRLHGIFFNAEQHLAQDFIVRNEVDFSDTQEQLHGNFPAMKIGHDQYYYVGHSWYVRIDKNHLDKLAEPSR